MQMGTLRNDDTVRSEDMKVETSQSIKKLAAQPQRGRRIRGSLFIGRGHQPFPVLEEHVAFIGIELHHDTLAERLVIDNVAYAVFGRHAVITLFSFCL
jgi:hypothetical protein